MQVPCRSVLCPTDLSKVGNLALPVAYRLTADGGTVHLLHVGEPPFVGNPLYNQFVQGYIPTAEEQREGEQRVREELQKLSARHAGERDVRTEHHFVEGVTVADTIEQEARRLEVDLIVMGTRGRTGLGRLVMGSVAMDVVHREKLPVVLVHEDPEAATGAE